MREVPQTDRPRERLLELGPKALTLQELIAVILGSGTKAVPVLDLAKEIVCRFGDQLPETTIEELCAVKGLGKAKALQLRACFALGDRLTGQKSRFGARITQPGDIYRLLKDEFCNASKEHFIAVLLDVKGYVIRYDPVFVGTLTNTLAHPREIFHYAIRHNAYSMVLAHNHPSGDPTPSREDLEVSKRLFRAGEVMGVEVRDHVVFGKGGYISIKEKFSSLCKENFTFSL